jgi:DNA-binding CsgD family transcriptional regulator
VHALEAEAQRALDNGQAATAARALQAAAELSISGEHRGRLAARAAQSLLTVTPYVGEVEVLLDMLARADLTHQESIWADWLRAEYMAEQDMRASLTFLVMAADRAREVDSEALPHILWSATYTAWAVGDGETALELAGSFVDWEATADHGTSGGLPPWAGRTMLGLTRFQLGDVAGAEQELAVAREMAATWEMPTDVDIRLLVNVVVLDQALGLLRSSSDPRLLTAVRRLEGDNAETMSFLRNIQAARALRVGETALARSLVEEGLDLSRAMQSSPNIILRLCTAVRIDAMTGGSDAMALHSDELRMLSRRLGHASAAAYASRAEGLLALAEGRLDDAVGSLEPLTADLLLGIGPTDPVPSGRVDLIEALVRTGDLVRATEVAGQVQQVLAPSGHPIATGLRHRAAALVARGEAAGALHTRAREAFEEAGDAFQVARTHLLHGEMLRRERRSAEARDELRAAAAAFERIGALPWQARALGELRATGSAVPLGIGTAWESLTAQERQVARAVARGGSNREVAAALFLSPRTVEHHLSSVFRKLGVRSRTALAHSLTAQALDEPVPSSAADPRVAEAAPPRRI